METSRYTNGKENMPPDTEHLQSTTLKHRKLVLTKWCDVQPTA